MPNLRENLTSLCICSVICHCIPLSQQADKPHTTAQIENQNLNLNSLLVTRQMTLFHQGVCMGEKLVPCTHE